MSGSRSPRGSSAATEVVCDDCSKQFLSLRNEIRKLTVSYVGVKEENITLKHNNDILSADLKAERKRSEKLLKHLKANGIDVPEQLQISKEPKELRKVSKSSSSASLSLSSSSGSSSSLIGEDGSVKSASVSQNLKFFWQSYDGKGDIVRASSSMPADEMAKYLNSIQSALHPQINIAKPGRVVIQESPCVFLDCNEDGTYDKNYFGLIPPSKILLAKLILFNDGLLLTQCITKKKMRPEAWIPLAGTFVEIDSEHNRTCNTFKISNESEGCHFAVYFDSKTTARTWCKDLRKAFQEHCETNQFAVPIAKVKMVNVEGYGKVPQVVKELMTALTLNDLSSEGLFRISGSRSNAEDIRDVIDQVDSSSN